MAPRPQFLLAILLLVEGNCHGQEMALAPTVVSGLPHESLQALSEPNGGRRLERRIEWDEPARAIPQGAAGSPCVVASPGTWQAGASSP